MLKHTVRKQKRGVQAGFSFLEISIVLTVSAVVIAGGLATAVSIFPQIKKRETNQKLDGIEQQLQYYVEANRRLPCPADPSLPVSDINFGIEDRNAALTGCESNGYNIYAVTDGTVGMIPTRTLGLDDSYALDGWGRRFMYGVDTNAVSDSAFINDTLMGLASNGSLRVDIPGGNRGSTLITQQAVYVLFSFGPNGHGGWMKASWSTRWNAVVSNNDEFENCHFNSSGSASAMNNIFVQGDTTTTNPSDPEHTTFDDILRYKLRWRFEEKSE